MRLSSKYIFILGLILVSLSGTSILFNHQGFALRLLIYAFWILVLATAYYIWEIENEK